MVLCHVMTSHYRVPIARKCGRGQGSKRVILWPRLLALVGVFGFVSSQNNAASAQTPASEMIACSKRVDQAFISPPELVSKGGILREKIALVDEFHRIPISVSPFGPGVVDCAEQWVRAFRGVSPSYLKQDQKEASADEPVPGPTLRARVGELVQLTFTNEVDPKREPGYGLEKCKQTALLSQATGQLEIVYPDRFRDSYPNCLHGSNAANIHFHGTHTNPNSTGDNVYLQIWPLPRKDQNGFAGSRGTDASKFATSPKEATVGLERFFERCTRELGYSALKSWPRVWADVPRIWIDKQKGLLLEQQQRYQDPNDPDATLPLWSADENLRRQGLWPIYYVGAFPYCFALPAKPLDEPPLASTSPIMGQAPGTHWYHAHKHGSTAINVMEGMAGAFIIEGKYDEDLNNAYGDYILKDRQGAETRWSARTQKVLVLNQFGVATGASASPRGTLRPNALIGGRVTKLTSQVSQGVDFAVNGRLRPHIRMQPGEIQLWRIVNASARTAAYFMAPPDGLEWRQLAQDGVQFAFRNYKNSANRPFYIAPANRVDLLVRAPTMPCPNVKPCEVRIQNVLSRSSVLPTPVAPTDDDPMPGAVLLSIDVEGQMPMRGDRAAKMEFFEELGGPKFPEQPKFLTNITEDDLMRSNNIKRTLVFNSMKSSENDSSTHTINGMQFDKDDHARLDIALGTTEEWTIKNLTNTTSGPAASNIDHPLHIHINPFQVTEMFDPNEKLINPNTGQLEAVFRDGSTQPVPLYVADQEQLLKDFQRY